MGKKPLHEPISKTTPHRLPRFVDADDLHDLWDDWPLSAEEEPCPLGHKIDLSVGVQPVAYLDGSIVGYCANCGDRVCFPRIEGGLVTGWVNALSAQLLAGDFDRDLMGDFAEAVEKLQSDFKAVESALATAEMAREVVRYRLAQDV